MPVRSMLLGTVLAVIIAAGAGQYSVNASWGDQWFARTCESVPFAGYGVALRHSVCGDRERARRALAKCTSSTMSTACVVAAAFLSGGGIAVLGVAGAVGALSGHGLEVAIKQTIVDEDIRKQCASLNVAECSQAVIFGAADAVVGGVGSAVAKKAPVLAANRIGSAIAGFIGGNAASLSIVTPAKITVGCWANKRNGQATTFLSLKDVAGDADFETIGNLTIATLKDNSTDVLDPVRNISSGILDVEHGARDANAVSNWRRPMEEPMDNVASLQGQAHNRTTRLPNYKVAAAPLAAVGAGILVSNVQRRPAARVGPPVTMRTRALVLSGAGMGTLAALAMSYRDARSFSRHRADPAAPSPSGAASVSVPPRTAFDTLVLAATVLSWAFVSL
ncbi:Uncharacterized protein PBTT_09513 [Plasmodiophora brassicae]